MFLDLDKPTSPDIRESVQPEEGWTANAFYEAVVQASEFNIPHRAILFSGFLDDNGEPGAYSCVWHPTYPNPLPLKYLRNYAIVRRI